mgnify:FL=1
MRPVRSLHLLVALLILATVALSGCRKPTEVGLQEALTQGAVTVTVTGLEARYLELESNAGAVITDRPALVISLTATNNGSAPVVWNLGWDVTTASQGQHALLFAAASYEDGLSAANNIPNLTLNDLRWVDDPVAEPVMLQPGETIEDRLLFSMPPLGTTSLVLSLPPRIFGDDVTMPGYIRMPWTAPTDLPGPVIQAADAAWEGNGFTFMVTGNAVQWVPLKDTANVDGISTQALLRVGFRVTNTGDTPMDYMPTTEAGNANFPSLVDASNNAIQNRAIFDSGVTVVGQVRERQTIAPGESLDDFLLFERPSRNVQELVLEFPARRFSRNGAVRLRMPFTWADPPQPPPWGPAPEAAE